jgi:hypothetical protein
MRMETVPVTNTLQDAIHQNLAAIGLEIVLVRIYHVLNLQMKLLASSL